MWQSSCYISMAAHEDRAELLEGKLKITNLQWYSCTTQGAKVCLVVSRKSQFTSQDKNQVPQEQTTTELNMCCHCSIKMLLECYLSGRLRY